MKPLHNNDEKPIHNYKKPLHNDDDKLINSYEKPIHNDENPTHSNNKSIYSYEYCVDDYNNKLKNYPFCNMQESCIFSIKNPQLAPTDTYQVLETAFRIAEDTHPVEEEDPQEILSSESLDVMHEMTSSSLMHGRYELKVDVTVGSRKVAEGTLSLLENKKYGLVGRNGAGKSSLLKAILRGECGVKRGEVEMIQQEFNSRKTPLEFVGEGGRKKLVIFGFTEEMQEQPINRLSSGWRMRCQLARAVHKEKPLCLLDEPTNFLDLKSIKLMEKEISKMNTTIVVSHDRNFLNEICDFIIFLREGKLKIYRGNFDQFEETLRKEETFQLEQFEKQQAEIKEAENFINRFRANAKRASQAQSRLKALQKMQRLQPPRKEFSTKFSFESQREQTKILLDLIDFSFSYGNRKIIENLSLRIENTSRIVIVGSNGKGKSTLLREIFKKTKNSSFFSQHLINSLDPSLTPLQFLMLKYPEEQARIRLSNFGINTGVSIKFLSGGQKSRLLFSSFGPSSLLLLDEPTSHLDLPTIAALSAAIKEFQGAVICVSHDLYFIRDCFTDIYECDSLTLTKIPQI